MARILKPTTPMDLSDVAVIEACTQLNVTTHGEALVAGMGNILRASAIAEKFRMIVCIVPDEMLKHPSAWAVITPTNGVYWSPGVT